MKQPRENVWIAAVATLPRNDEWLHKFQFIALNNKKYSPLYFACEDSGQFVYLQENAKNRHPLLGELFLFFRFGIKYDVCINKAQIPVPFRAENGAFQKEQIYRFPQEYPSENIDRFGKYGKLFKYGKRNNDG